MANQPPKSPQTVYIGLGSNLENPAQQITKALEAIQEIPNTQLIKHSSLYCGKPVGPQDQPDFTNAVAELSTTLSPLALLSQLQKIENEHGRVRERHWGPRTLDLDLLLYGEDTIDHPQLIVPHREMLRRSFVLYPLFEISPELVLPNKMDLQSALDKCPLDGLQRIPEQTLE